MNFERVLRIAIMLDTLGVIQIRELAAVQRLLAAIQDVSGMNQDDVPGPVRRLLDALDEIF